MKKTIENFQKMGLDKLEAEDLYYRIKVGTVDNQVLAEITNVIVKCGDPRNFHEFLHMAHFTKDIDYIVNEIKSEYGTCQQKFFGFIDHAGNNTMEKKLTALYYVGLGHDLALTLTREGLNEFMDLEKGASRLGEPNKRFVSEHHRRSKIILSQILTPKVNIEEDVYNGVMDGLELSSVTMTKEESQDLRKQNRLYQTIPMIVDGVAKTKENYARGVAESSFAEDHVVAFLTGKITADKATEEIKKQAKEVESSGSKIVGEHRFNYDEMEKRLAEKKNFQFLNYVKKHIPNVYSAIVESAEGAELERALQHPWYRAGVDGGLKVVEDALKEKRIRADMPISKALENLGTTIEKYAPLFTGRTQKNEVK